MIVPVFRNIPPNIPLSFSSLMTTPHWSTHTKGREHSHGPRLCVLLLLLWPLTVRSCFQLLLKPTTSQLPMLIVCCFFSPCAVDIPHVATSEQRVFTWLLVPLSTVRDKTWKHTKFWSQAWWHSLCSYECMTWVWLRHLIISLFHTAGWIKIFTCPLYIILNTLFLLLFLYFPEYVVKPFLPWCLRLFQCLH